MSHTHSGAAFFAGSHPEPWPALPLASWRPTCETLHMWTQIVGKVRLALTPHVNHWWEAPLYVSTRGLTTSPIPYHDRAFEIEFDFVGHDVAVRDNSGAARFLPLHPRSVSDFYRELFSVLRTLNIDVKIWPKPVEIPDPIPFAEDETHAAYDAEYAGRFHRVLLSAAAAFQEFRSRYAGKVSPVHFFWGSFDLAVTRFSGRRAPERPGADAVTRDAYSHECISAGFWPGSGAVDDAAFYCYAAPEPEGFAAARIHPAAAFYDPNLHEYLLMYRDVRSAPDPKTAVLDFCQSTYEAGAGPGRWDRAALEYAASAP